MILISLSYACFAACSPAGCSIITGFKVGITSPLKDTISQKIPMD
jgi:hypothetical protein